MSSIVVFLHRVQAFYQPIIERREKKARLKNTCSPIAVLLLSAIPVEEGAQNLDDFVKSLSAALCCILSHCGVLVSMPHSFEFVRLASETFYLVV
jgi:hypothetical protein